MIAATSTLPGSSNPASLNLKQCLINDAAKWTGRKEEKGQIPFDVDHSVLIIEEGEGELVYSTGDLSFLTPVIDPEIFEDFASQLHPDIQDEYRQRQLAVWDFDLPQLGNFKTKCGREAVMFPLCVSQQRYTFTVFSKA
jgi:hypothetical protein